ncbi:tetratricopeptide repeat protein [Pendulispora albinea]|uniref:Sel1 repeat family protein n=1 Tax=Pendulispora albinea TaxID=2741071 RepID=A0ABZ2MAU6_9BACT
MRIAAELALGALVVANGGGCGGAPPPVDREARARDARETTPPQATCASERSSERTGSTATACACGDEATCVAKCEGGSASDCFTLGGCYSGLGFARDPAKVATYSARGCELGSASACTNLAKAYASGFGVPRDPARAEQLFAKAAKGHRTGCDAGVAGDCYMLGYAYEHGEGVPREPATTARLRQRACTLGHTASCLLLALDAKATGNADDAVRWFGAACETTCTGCDDVRDALLQGVPAARRLLQRWQGRCDAGEQPACRARATVRTDAPSPSGRR